MLGDVFFICSHLVGMVVSKIDGFEYSAHDVALQFAQYERLKKAPMMQLCNYALLNVWVPFLQQILKFNHA